MTRLPERNLDILRTVAVTCVLLDHLLAPFTAHLGFMNLWRLGRMGVLLFFVHTSLVLMASLERLTLHGASRWGWTKAFYIRRAFRIYPLAIATVLVVLAFHIPYAFANRGPHPPYTVPSALTVVTNLTLVQNLFYAPDLMGPLWSLPIEVQMYVVLPLLFLIARRSWTWLLVSLGIAMVAGLAVQFANIPGIGRLSMLAFAPCFVAGVLAYRLCMTRRPTLPAWGWPLAMVAAMALFAACRATPDHLERGWPFCLLLGCLIPLIAELPASWITRAAAQVAKYSYGVYLSHVLLLWLTTVVLYHFPALVRWSVFVVLLVAVPVLAYHLIEAPAIRLGTRLAHGTLRANTSQLDASTAPAP